MQPEKEKIKMIDLFSGLGGFRLAFEDKDVECVFSSDIDKHARETYKLNFNEYPEGDITLIDSKNIPNFDILTAGFPCQPFSVAGKRLGFEDTRGTLFFEVARILKDKKPKSFLLENVKGFTNHDNGKTMAVILQTLKDLDYHTEWKVLNAKDFGIPQNRERWYCVGIRNDLYDNKTSFFPNQNDVLENYDLSKVIENNVDDSYKITSTANKNINLHIHNKNIQVNDLTIAYDVRPSRCRFSNNSISPCLTAKMGTGGNNVPIVVSQNRKLTEKECLKIMGFPETYKITKGYQSYKQIGNSIAVPLVGLIAKKMLKYLKGK